LALFWEFGRSGNNERRCIALALVALRIGAALGFFASAIGRVGGDGAHCEETSAGLDPDAKPKLDPWLEWDAGAFEIYQKVGADMDAYEGTDRRRYELGMRVCENAVRMATIVAVGRGSRVVEIPDIRWALSLSQQSFNVVMDGASHYMIEYMELPKLVAAILEALSEAGGFLSIRDLKRTFRKNQRWVTQLDQPPSSSPPPMFPSSPSPASSTPGLPDGRRGRRRKSSLLSQLPRPFVVDFRRNKVPNAYCFVGFAACICARTTSKSAART
jgi:hypothetical protein